MKFKTFIISLLCMSAMTCMAVENKLYGADVTLAKGATSGNMDIFLNNSTTICAMQFDIYLPTGVTLKMGRSGYSITKGANRFEGTDHSLSSALQSDGSIRVMITSTTNKDIWDESEEGTDIRTTDPIATLPLVIDASQTTGTYDVLIKNIVLSHYDSKTTKYTTDNTSISLFIKPATGVEENVVGNVAAFASATGEKVSKESYQTFVAAHASSLTGVDLRAAELGSDIKTVADLKPVGLNANALVLLPNGSTIKGENVVVDGNCESLKITDGATFGTSTIFTAAEAKYSRSMSYTWGGETTSTTFGTVCLPYEVTSDATIQYYKLAGVTSDKMTFEPVASVAAGTPAVFKKLSGDDAEMNAENVSVSAGDQQWSGTVGDKTWTMKGTMEATTIDPSSCTNDIYYIADNKFWYANKSFAVAAFRGWFETPKAVSPAKSFSIGTWEDTPTGINYVENNDGTVDVIFDIAGRKQPKAKSGINIINGKKVLVR